MSTSFSGISRASRALCCRTSIARRKFKFLVAMQRYSKLNKEEHENVEFLLRAYPDLQIAYLEEEPPRREGDEPRIFSALIEFVTETGRRQLAQLYLPFPALAFTVQHLARRLEPLSQRPRRPSTSTKLQFTRSHLEHHPRVGGRDQTVLRVEAPLQPSIEDSIAATPPFRSLRDTQPLPSIGAAFHPSAAIVRLNSAMCVSLPCPRSVCDSPRTQPLPFGWRSPHAPRRACTLPVNLCARGTAYPRVLVEMGVDRESGFAGTDAATAAWDGPACSWCCACPRRRACETGEWLRGCGCGVDGEGEGVDYQRVVEAFPIILTRPRMRRRLQPPTPSRPRLSSVHAHTQALPSPSTRLCRPPSSFAPRPLSLPARAPPPSSVATTTLRHCHCAGEFTRASLTILRSISTMWMTPLTKLAVISVNAGKRYRYGINYPGVEEISKQFSGQQVPPRVVVLRPELDLQVDGVNHKPLTVDSIQIFDPHLSSAKRRQRTQAFTSNMVHAALERQLAAAQTTRMELETKLRERDMMLEKLKRDRRWFSDREQEEREEKEREREEHATQTVCILIRATLPSGSFLSEERKDSELRTLRSSLTALREELADLTDAHAGLGRSTAQTIASQKSQITTLTRQTALLEEEMSQFKLLAEERSQTIDEIQVQFQELSSAPTAGKEQESSDMAVVREELHRQAAYLRGLEGTNARLGAELAVLRKRHTSIEVLREEKRGLERKLQPLDALRERVLYPQGACSATASQARIGNTSLRTPPSLQRAARRALRVQVRRVILLPHALIQRAHPRDGRHEGPGVQRQVLWERAVPESSRVRIYTKLLAMADMEAKYKPKILVSQIWNAIIISRYREHLLSIEHVQKLLHHQVNTAKGRRSLHAPPFFIAEGEKESGDFFPRGKSEDRHPAAIPVDAMPTFTVLTPALQREDPAVAARDHPGGGQKYARDAVQVPQAAKSLGTYSHALEFWSCTNGDLNSWLLQDTTDAAYSSNYFWTPRADNGGR
ncbi:hypothetical protein DFH09DRAFT_1087433 [Mycena vulgaris]|nr:hypothetical protein DFH09DRAFT_1087433 [Mycena vulgaris]